MPIFVGNFTSFFFAPRTLKLLLPVSTTSSSANKETVITLQSIKDSFKNQSFPFVDVIKYLDEYKETYIGKDVEDNKAVIGLFITLKEEKTFFNLYGLIGETNFTYYIPLHLVVFFTNKFIQDSSTSEKFALINESSLQEFFSFENYVNLNPKVCVAPVIPTYETTVYPFVNNRRESRVITDIWVSTDAVATTLKDFINSEDDPENLDIFSWFKGLLKKIETNLGGINDFDLEFSEELNIYTIVDRKFSNPPAQDTIPVVDVFGIGSIALDLSIQTKITSKLGAQISIAAQGPGGEAQFNSSMPEFKKWNKNLVDRFDPPQKQTPSVGTNTVLATSTQPFGIGVLGIENLNYQGSSPKDLLGFDPLNPNKKKLFIAKPKQKSSEEQQIEDFEKKADAFYKKIKELYDQWNKGELNEDDGWNSIITQGQTLYSIIASDYNISKGLPPQGIIPTVISMKIHGIGGIKIGQSFRIKEGVLPKRYAQFGYIITGIEHFIENNKWVTEVKAQTYYIGKPDQEEVSKATERLRRFEPFRSTTPTSTSTSTSTGTLPAAGTPTSATTPTPKELGPVDDNRRFWTLVAVCSREDGNPQGWADVAQSIYNRNAGGPRIGYKSDVVAQILGVWQYEPTWKFPRLGLVSVPNPQWSKIKDLQTAAAAAGLLPSRLQEVAKALQDPTLQQNARTVIQGRTDFLGANQPATNMKQKIQRKNGNKFGFNWGYQPPAGGTTAPVPSYVTSAKV